MKDLPTSTPFNVPEGFFDEQRQSIQQRMEAEPQVVSKFYELNRAQWFRVAAFWVGLIGVVLGVQQWNAADPCQTYSCLLEQHEQSLTIPDDILEEWLDDGTLFDDILLDEV